MKLSKLGKYFCVKDDGQLGHDNEGIEYEDDFCFRLEPTAHRQECQVVRPEYIFTLDVLDALGYAMAFTVAIYNNTNGFDIWLDGLPANMDDVCDIKLTVWENLVLNVKIKLGRLKHHIHKKDLNLENSFR